MNALWTMHEEAKAIIQFLTTDHEFRIEATDISLESKFCETNLETVGVQRVSL